LLAVSIPLWNLSFDGILGNSNTTYLGLDEQFVESIISQSDVPAREGIGMEGVFFLIYLLGVIIVLIKYFRNFLLIVKLRSQGKLKKLEQYYLVNISEPYPVFSFFNTVYWSDALTYSKEETQQVLLHEQVHMEQRHSVDILLFELLNALLWFFPLVYGFKKYLKDTHEYIADQVVFSKSEFEDSYVDLLMKEVRVNNYDRLDLVNPLYNNQLKKRLMMINSSSKHSKKSIFFAIIPVLFLMVFVFSCNRKATIEPVKTTQKAKPGSIYQAVDFTEDGLVQMKDGSTITVDEMKEIVIKRRFEAGDVVTKDQVFIISKLEMMNSVKYVN